MAETPPQPHPRAVKWTAFEDGQLCKVLRMDAIPMLRSIVKNRRLKEVHTIASDYLNRSKSPTKVKSHLQKLCRHQRNQEFKHFLVFEARSIDPDSDAAKYPFHSFTQLVAEMPGVVGENHIMQMGIPPPQDNDDEELMSALGKRMLSFAEHIQPNLTKQITTDPLTADLDELARILQKVQSNSKDPFA